MADTPGRPDRPPPDDRPDDHPDAARTELARLRAETAYHQRLRDLSLVFSRGVSSTLSLGTALDAFAHEANTLFGAHRTSVWLHDRRARELVLAASSDPAHAATAARVATSDAQAPAARGLRLDRPRILVEGPGRLLLAPLRGWRRALGTIVVDRPEAPQLDDAQLAELAHELGRQLSAGVENVQLLEEVLRQRRLLEDTFNSLIDLVVVTDNARRVVQTNDAFAARLGASRAELLERDLDALVGPALAAWVASLDPSDASAEPTEGVRTRRLDDEKLGGKFLATMTPLINQDGDPVGRVLVMRDITLQTRLESEREALRQRLVQSEKLAALGQFVAGIAHEMNNPLQGVLGHLELLIETSDLARPLKQDLRRIYHEADRAAKIVRNLLAFTGSRKLTRRRIRVDRVLSRVVASRKAALKRHGVEVVRQYADDLPAVNADPLLLHQAFLNVIINAEHASAASGPGGRIELRTAAGNGGSSVVTTIRDTGPGLAEDVLPRVFEPFFTTKEVGQGTGLGLAITYGIIQEHGGAIQAANAEGGGAVFTIELPAAQEI
jgi:PAS domain S-box-containing protein